MSHLIIRRRGELGLTFGQSVGRIASSPSLFPFFFGAIGPSSLWRITDAFETSPNSNVRLVFRHGLPLADTYCSRPTASISNDRSSPLGIPLVHVVGPVQREQL